MIKVQTGQGEITISSAVFTTITGAALGTIGVRIPRCHPETIRLIEIVRV